jgi:hypothetical protein
MYSVTPRACFYCHEGDKNKINVDAKVADKLFKMLGRGGNLPIFFSIWAVGFAVKM